MSIAVMSKVASAGILVKDEEDGGHTVRQSILTGESERCIMHHCGPDAYVRMWLVLGGVHQHGTSGRT
eukprot:CAMPEP_0198226428 /NCGR_PEP_ID=MMETSP1445-20131203/105243_1 /TAXON_ID=36898 /ORGANISM="Pyramimonas sp., Strain CCMP2087" /LENGTH=67 /DNA_ID=CAMNT_0043906235 /DNA_START=48 /DNA_END=248 /DNA_ORIENTATION=+